MKRSTKVALVLMGSTAALTMLSGCDDQPAQVADNGGTFQTMAQCVAVYDQQTCQQAQQLANQQHWQNAPHYSSYDQCVAQFGPGGCTTGNTYGGSSNVFMPLMVGYMLGSAHSTPAPLYYGPGSWHHAGQAGYQAPIYTSGRGYSRSTPVASVPFTSTRPTISAKGSLSSTTALTPAASTRGGFGSLSGMKMSQSFTSTYSKSNPSAFGHSALPTTSARFASVSRSSSYSSGSSFSSSRSSFSSRGGFGSTGRSFGGGFGG